MPGKEVVLIRNNFKYIFKRHLDLRINHTFFLPLITRQFRIEVVLQF